MNKFLLWLIGNACIGLLPVPSAAQDESGVVADGLIALAEVPLRVYLLDGRQPIDLPSLPELTPISHIPMGDHPQLPDTIHVIAVVEKSRNTPGRSTRGPAFC